ncbi:uncharacterized protein LOC108664961 [Hyalella azteca]|uniref:Uncharacterized protein LOC108664961 n=1 Tax=Hyalella azteca TaxID=294128 RepID=A0A8B7N1P9_HYAAZ|nr:uncharacterized protein LOC108664961 [Hyalella azteca]
MEELTSCGRPQKVPPAPDKNLPITAPAAKISDSQIDFFRMLDERIENGPDDISLDEQRSKLFSRSTSDERHASGNSGALAQAAMHRRWSASKITNPRTPATPEETRDSLMRRERSPSNRSPDSASAELDEDQRERLLSEPCDMQESLSDDNSSCDQPRENFKEQYVFLGNVYTVTRPRKTYSLPTDRSPSPALVAVTQRMTAEDLHLQGIMDECFPGYGNEKMRSGDLSPDSEANQFWMGFESPEPTERPSNRSSKSRSSRGLPCDIARPGLSSLRPVVE